MRALFKKLLYYFCAPCRPHRSLTIRYAFPLVFAVAAILSAAAIVSDNRSFIHLDSSAQTVKAGDTFQIKVYVSASVPVNAVDIRLAFPSDQIQILGIDKGQSVITLWAQDPYVDTNTVILQGGTFRRGFVGDHLIATINAKAIQTGLAKFSTDQVTLLAGDGSGSKVQVAQSNADSATFYIANADGTPAASQNNPIGVQGAASVVIITDIDGDGKVTLADVSKFMAGWFSGGTIYDFNHDGHMTFADFAIILADSFFGH